MPRRSSRSNRRSSSSRTRPRRSRTDLRSRVAYNNSWRKTDGLLPAQNGTEPLGTNYSKTSTFPNWSLSGNLDWVATPEAVLRGSRRLLHADQHDSNVTNEPRYIFNTPRISVCPAFPSTCSVSRASRAFRQPHSTGRSRPADARELPGRRHGLRQVRRRAPDQVRRAGRPVGNNVLAARCAIA